MSQFSLPLDSAALDRLEDKDLDRVRESAYQDLIEQGRAALVLRDELASRSRVSAQHATHHDDCGCLTARYEARIATLEAELALSQRHCGEMRRALMVEGIEVVQLMPDDTMPLSAWEEMAGYAFEMRDALERLFAFCAGLDSESPGEGRNLFVTHTCRQCTSDTTPDRLNAGPCAFHQAEAALAKAEAAASLAAHDVEVLEPYLPLVHYALEHDELGEWSGDSTHDKTVRAWCATARRALAAQAATHSVPDGTSEVKP